MSAPAPRQKPPAPDIGGAAAYRKELADGVRVHIDRPLPFLVLNRDPGSAISLARRVATITASNVVWPADPGADAAAASAIADVLVVLRRDFPSFLLASIHDLAADASLGGESARLEPFRFVLGASQDAPAQAAARQLQAALSKICIDLREPVIEWTDHAPVDSGAHAQLEDIEGISRVSLGLPQIHRVPGGKRIYPQIFHELETRVLDALLQAFAAFVDATTPRGDDTQERARPHRSLGRSRYIEAAVEVDRELGRISRSFDFLLGVSPINSMQAYEQYEAGKRANEPQFRYRPLSVNPDLAKRDLYAIDLRAVEDPVIETLFREKQQDLDQQLMMLQRRNTPGFRYVSLLQYGGVEQPLLEQARAILAHVGPEEACRAPAGTVDCEGIRQAAETMIARYRHKVPEFKSAVVCLREDIPPGLMVSGESLLVATTTRMTRARLDALLQHEVGVHLLTCINGNQQGLGIFGTGLAGYEGVQEGLGVFAEFVSGGLTVARLRLLAARVLVVDAMLGGAGFIDCHRLLHGDHGFTSLRAFNIVARIFRSGGLTKDAIYLRGFNQVFAFVASGRVLDPFWFGKIAEQHVPVVEELHARGILRLPVATPEFLARPEARRTIAAIRDGTSFIDLFRNPQPC
jgi:uncharacterized protein (TIGR02421 family)